MDKPKFTPGPWVIGGTGRLVVHATNDIYAPNGTFKFSSVQDEANSNLISAAPDLFDALNQIVFRLSDYFPNTASALLEDAKAALKKAQGGDQ